jgi:tetratricopeptide (TPR) repeat protein
MLAYAYSRIGNMAASLGHGMTALGYGYRTDSRLAKGRATYILSVSYLASNYFGDTNVVTNLMELAEKTLSLAENFLVRTGLAFADFHMAIQHANILCQKLNFIQAVNWYWSALEAAEVLNRTRFIVVAEHGLGITEMHLGNFQSAREHLLVAHDLWRELKVDYEIANVLHALGVLEVHLSDNATALSYLEECRTICEKFQYMESFRRLMEQAQVDINLLLQ